MTTPLDWLMLSLCPHGVPEEKPVSFYTAYYDASGAPGDSKFVVVSGFVANFMQWKAFENGWDDIHQKHGVSRPFHMTEFMARHQPGNEGSQYRKWASDSVEATEFLVQLGRMVQLCCLVGFSAIVSMDIYKDVSTAFPLETIVPPYALGARMCIASMHTWQMNHGMSEWDIESIFEKGDLGQSQFKYLMEVEGMEAPIFKKKDDYAGLQAADLMGWEQSFFLKRELRNEHIPPRPPFAWLLNVPHVHTVVTKEMLIPI